MPSRVPGDQVTGSSRVRGGIRQVLRSTPRAGSCGGWWRGLAAGHPAQHRSRGGGQYNQGQGQATGDRDDVDVGEQGGGHQDPRQQQQGADDQPGDPVEPGPIDPGPQHFPVVARQQQEHAGAGQQQTGKGLRRGGDQSERGAGDQDDGRGHPPSRCRTGRTVWRRRTRGAASASCRTRRRRRSWWPGDRGGADDRGVHQHDRKEQPSTSLCWPSRCAMSPASVKLPAVLVERAAQSPVISRAAAPTITTKAPSTVSARS